MCKGAREWGIRGWTLALGVGLALIGGGAPAQAAPEAAIQDVRVAAQQGFDRIVFDLSAAGVPAAVGNEPEQLRLAATAPLLDRATQADLDRLGVRLEESLAGTRVRLSAPAGRWTAFRLPARSPGEGDRIVLDLGRGAAPPPIPSDADPLTGGSRAQPAATAPPPRVPTSAPGSPAGGAPPTLGGSPPPSRAANGSGPPSPLWVRPEGIEFQGLSAAGPGREQLLDLELQVRSAAGGDWEDGYGEPGAVRRRIRDLVGGGNFAPRLEGGVLQQLTARIADAYAARGMYGTRVDIRRSTLMPLMNQQPAPLVVHIEERPARP